MFDLRKLVKEITFIVNRKLYKQFSYSTKNIVMQPITETANTSIFPRRTYSLSHFMLHLPPGFSYVHHSLLLICNRKQTKQSSVNCILSALRCSTNMRVFVIYTARESHASAVKYQKRIGRQYTYTTGCEMRVRPLSTLYS